MIYPGGVVKRGTTELSPEIRVTPQTPPCFFAHAGDDRVSPENSVAMYLALKRAGVPAELHIYASGGHGFGLRPTGKPAATWPKRCEEWLRDTGGSQGWHRPRAIDCPGLARHQRERGRGSFSHDFQVGHTASRPQRGSSARCSQREQPRFPGGGR